MRGRISSLPRSAFASVVSEASTDFNPNTDGLLATFPARLVDGNIVLRKDSRAPVGAKEYELAAPAIRAVRNSRDIILSS